MIRIAVLEDNNDMVMELRRYFDRYEAENPVRWSRSLFTDENKLLLDCRYCSDYQIILADMDYRKEERFQTILKIQETEKNCAFVLLSSDEEIFREGYRIEAAGCLIKPVTYRKFEELLHTILAPLEEQGTKGLLFPVSDGFKRVQESRILYMERKGERLVCHTMDGDFDAEEGNGTIMDRLSGDTFFRCGKMYLINLENVDGIQENEIRMGSRRIPVTPAESKETLAALNRYLSEVGV